jgi:hypothetical protein
MSYEREVLTYKEVNGFNSGPVTVSCKSYAFSQSICALSRYLSPQYPSMQLVYTLLYDLAVNLLAALSSKPTP